jgi:NAD(P)-dependent dehydrogenase (short-subunit alcohol dehydrogenase family)
MGGFQGSVKFKGLSAYSSSKAAMVGVTECLAEELKERTRTEREIQALTARLITAQEEEQIDLSADREVEIPATPRKEVPANNEDRQLKKAIEILKDPQAAKRAA